MGPGVAVFKKDLVSAFRQLWGDPFDYSLMLYKWKSEGEEVAKYYVDLAVAMGMRSSPAACQRVSDAIRYLHNKQGYWLMNYIDDFIAAEKWSKIWQSYHALTELLQRLGVKESVSKESPPDVEIDCLGTMVNTLKMTISVTPERMEELRSILGIWKSKTHATRHQLEQLIGKIQFAATCVRQGRVFITRLLNWLRSMNRTNTYAIPNEAKKDIHWWYKYIKIYSGVSMLWLHQATGIDTQLATDACLQACGGNSGKEYFRVRFPQHIMHEADGNIAILKMLALIVGVKIWGARITGSRIRVYCDNQACVEVISTGRAYHPVLQSCLRELAYITALHECLIKPIYTSDQKITGYQTI